MGPTPILFTWNMIKEIFGGTPGDGDIPYTYGPCNAGLNAAWNTDYITAILDWRVGQHHVTPAPKI